MLLALVMGCRSMSLGFVLVAPDDMAVRQAYARVQRHHLRDCDGDVSREWVGQRLDLLMTTPEVLRDRAWCGIDIEFKEAPLLGPALGWRGDTASGIGFDIALSPGTVSLEQPFGGSGEDHVILLDLSALMTAEELELLALESEPALEEVSLMEGSPWSQERREQLPGALAVLPVQQARQRTDWSIGAFGAPVETSGCGASREDTSSWWEDTAYPDSNGGSSYDSGARSYDTDAATDSGVPSSGGCSCSGSSSDTGADTGSDADHDAEADTDEDTGTDTSGGCLGGDDTGDSDTGWAALKQRAGLASLVCLIWLKRRRGTAAPEVS